MKTCHAESNGSGIGYEMPSSRHVRNPLCLQLKFTGRNCPLSSTHSCVGAFVVNLMSLLLAAVCSSTGLAAMANANWSPSPLRCVQYSPWPLGYGWFARKLHAFPVYA